MVNKEITYSCIGFCNIAPAVANFDQTQSVNLPAFVIGGGVEGWLPRMLNLPRMKWRFNYTHIATGDKTVSFGADATRSLQYNVSQDIDIARVSVIVPLGGDNANRDPCDTDRGVADAQTLADCNKMYPLGLSDVRVKRDVSRVGQLDNGLALYRYKYLWSDQIYVGVMGPGGGGRSAQCGCSWRGRLSPR